MRPGTDYVTPENRVSTSDPRFDMRLNEKFDDDDASDSAWTWVTAILIAGVLIVSGYLDQETGSSDRVSATTGGEIYAANTPAPPAAVGANRTDPRFVKGY